MNPSLQPTVQVTVGPLGFTDTLLASFALSALIGLLAAVGMRIPRVRGALEVIYESLENAILDAVQVDARPLVPLILTQWIFILAANLAGLVPGVSSPTRDLSVAAALALIAFFAGHLFALRVQGLSYLRTYLSPNPLLLPFNIVGELSRTVALALRLFGNMLSGHLVGAILVYLVGVLLPVPLLLLGVLTSVVQAYIFGVLTLVFAAGSLEAARRPAKGQNGSPA
jgi:F-type H+-transporting ATPase subunit a